MKMVIVCLLVISLGLLLKSCNSVEPPPNGDKPTLMLKLEDVSCTEAWITLTTTNLQLPTTVTLKQNEQTRTTINLIKADTLLYIDSLLPNQVYTFQATSIQYPVSSNQLNVTTLDTTSQNFTFETFEFGDGFESSYFNDVWIFNESDIWVCGNVFTNDSTDGNLYHWNGSYWKAHRLNFVDMEGIWGINNIMYLASGGVWKYDRVNLVRQNIEGSFGQGQAVHKLWGSSESNIYGVGPWGTIVWYNGVKWTKIEFDTQWSFYGITGNKETGVAYAVGRNMNFSTVIVQLNGSSTTVLFDNQNYYPFNNSYSGLWLKDRLYLAERRIWTLIPGIIKPNDLYILPFGIGIYVITGTDKNNIFFFGGNATMVHFNGVRFQMFDIGINSDNYGGGYSAINIAARVGFANNKAYITIIRRNQ